MFGVFYYLERYGFESNIIQSYTFVDINIIENEITFCREVSQNDWFLNFGHI